MLELLMALLLYYFQKIPELFRFATYIWQLWPWFKCENFGLVLRSSRDLHNDYLSSWLRWIQSITTAEGKKFIAKRPLKSTVPQRKPVKSHLNLNNSFEFCPFTSFLGSQKFPSKLVGPIRLWGKTANRLTKKEEEEVRAQCHLKTWLLPNFVLSLWLFIANYEEQFPKLQLQDPILSVYVCVCMRTFQLWFVERPKSLIVFLPSLHLFSFFYPSFFTLNVVSPALNCFRPKVLNWQRA